MRSGHPLVVAADGNSTRLSIAMGLRKRDDRPIGVAYRAYYRNPRHNDDWLESWLELRDAEHPDHLLPGYGWIFGMGDGTSNIGLGILNTSSAFRGVDYRDMMRRWLASTPPELFFKPPRTSPATTNSRSTPRGRCWTCSCRAAAAAATTRQEEANSMSTPKSSCAALSTTRDKDQGWSVEGRIPSQRLPAQRRPARIRRGWKFALCRYDYSGEPEAGTVYLRPAQIAKVRISTTSRITPP